MRSEDDAVTKLTFRQKVSLCKALDLYNEMQEPFHYSLLADRLGVSESTAYDMLRRLEEKGLVAYEFVTPKKIAGPGRSSVVFSPTAKAREVISQLAHGSAKEEEWEVIKSRILDNLRQSKASDYNDMLRDLLAMIPETRSPLACCAEIVATLLLSLRQARYSLATQSPLGILLSRLSSRLGMSMLTGLATGLMLANKTSRRAFSQFERYMERYEESLEQLTPEALQTLHGYTREVLEILASKEG